MKITRKALLGMAAAATLATLGGAAVAQPPQGFGPPGGPGGRGGPPPSPADRAANLRQQLQITAGQEGSFQTWLAATTPQPPQGRGARADMRNMGTLQRLDAQLAEAAQRQADLKVRVDATKRFYAALSADQKTAFDALPPPVMLGMGGGRGGPMMAMREGRGGRGPEGGAQQRRRGGGQDGEGRTFRGLPGAYDPQ